MDCLVQPIRKESVPMSTASTYFIIFCCVFIILTWAAYVPFRAGLLYNGTVYCMAIGGYFAGVAAKSWGWPFWACVLGAMIVGSILGFIPAIGFSRTSGIVTAVSSMALIFIIQSFISNIDFLGGTRGISGIPKVENLLLYSIITVIIVAVFIYRLDKSRIGRAFESIQTDPDMAATLGINVKRMTILGLTISSALGALAGALYAFNMRVIYPQTFGFTLLLSVMTMLFVGGRYMQWGMFLSVPLLWGLSKWMPDSFSVYTQIIYGIVLIVVLMIRPEGIITRKLVAKVKSMFVRKNNVTN